MSFVNGVNKSYDDKLSEKSLRRRIFFGCLFITSIISLLFVIEGYDSAIDFGHRVEGSQLHENAEHVIEVLDSSSNDNNELLHSIVDHLHTTNESAVIVKNNGNIIQSVEGIGLDKINDIISLIDVESTKHHSSNKTESHDHSSMCDGEFCLVECGGEEFNWMIHQSKKYGDVLIIQKHNLISAAKDYVIPRMLTSAVVVVWLASWFSFGIAVILSKFIGKYHQSLKIHVFNDRVTGLLNEKALIDKLYKITDIDDMRYYLAFISIDNINEFQFLHGIELRDLIMKKVSLSIGAFSGDGLLGVYNHNTFFLLVNTHDNKLDKLKENIFLLSKSCLDAAGVKFSPVFSIGEKYFDSNDFTPNDVLGNAAYALEIAQKTRSKVFTYDDKNSEEMLFNSELYNDLLNAISNNEFVLYFQPKINIRTKAISGVEALVRWKHPKKGIIYPDQFLDLVEKSSIANFFSSHIVDLALVQINEWNSLGLEINVAINVSPNDLDGETFINYISKLHSNGAIKPSMLDVELTEIANSVCIKKLATVLYKLRDMGIRCSIDDFGTGMGSLTYLKDIPVHAVKIDRSFVQDMDVNPTSYAITDATVRLANRLGCLAIAEGIENEYIEKELLKIGCDIGQGYLYSKPIPGNEVFDFIIEHNEKCIFLNNESKDALVCK